MNNVLPFRGAPVVSAVPVAPAGEVATPASIAQALIDDYRAQVRNWQLAAAALAAVAGYQYYKYVAKPERAARKGARTGTTKPFLRL